MQEIAAALSAFGQRSSADGSRLTALVPGNEDLSLSLGVGPTAEIMTPALWPLIMAARAYGHVLLGSIGSGGDFRDLEAYRNHVERSMLFGFDGVTCIHPAQVQVINELYEQRSGPEIEWARRAIEAFEVGSGKAVEVDGRMVDRPLYLRARRVVGR